MLLTIPLAARRLAFDISWAGLVCLVALTGTNPLVAVGQSAKQQQTTAQSVSGQTPQQELEPSKQQVASNIDEYFAKLTQQKMFNGNVLVVIDNDVVIRKSFNLAEANSTLRADTDCQFITASISKLFVKFAVLTLLEKKTLSLADPVSKFFPGINQGTQLTIQHLIEHQSGLPRELVNVDQLKSISLNEFVQLACKEKLEFEPGTDRHYSNVAYQLLVAIIDQVTGDYMTYMDDQIFKKLGMLETSEFASEKATRLTRGHKREKDNWVEKDDSDLTRFQYLRVYSTIDDLHAFANSLTDGSSVSRNVRSGMMNGKSTVSHAGSLNGNRIWFFTEPDSGTTIVFWANINETPFVRITQDLSRIIAGNDYEIPSAVKRIAIQVPEKKLRQYTGTYSLKIDPSQVFKIKLQDKQLILIDSDGDTTALFAESDTTFFAEPDSSDSIEITLNKKTGKHDMHLIIEGGMRLETTRK